MAETFVFDVANSLLGKLTSYAYQEASQAYGVYEEPRRIKDTLLIVKGFLLDAEEKKHQQHALREWLRQIQNICFDAEDVLDGFEIQHKRKQVVKASGSINKKMSVDLKRGETLPIHINMTFPSLPCDVLSVDAIDMSGKHEVDLDTNIWKLKVEKIDLIELCDASESELSNVTLPKATYFIPTDKASMLDEAIEYLKTLQLHLQVSTNPSFSEKH